MVQLTIHSMDGGRERIPVNGWGFLQMLSSVQLGQSEGLRNFDAEECVEARFFSEDREVRFFRREGNLECVELSDTEGSDHIDRDYLVAGLFRESGKSVTVRYYLDEDEDGQVYVSGTRLVGVQGG